MDNLGIDNGSFCPPGMWQEAPSCVDCGQVIEIERGAKFPVASESNCTCLCACPGEDKELKKHCDKLSLLYVGNNEFQYTKI